MKEYYFAKGRVEPMKRALRRRFWLEMSLAIVTCILFVVTLVQRDWIEVAFRVDPDNGSGALEWLIVGALFVITLMLVILAGYEWRRARIAAS
jgi:hypothetical protein